MSSSLDIGSQEELARLEMELAQAQANAAKAALDAARARAAAAKAKSAEAAAPPLPPAAPPPVASGPVVTAEQSPVASPTPVAAAVVAAPVVKATETLPKATETLAKATESPAKAPANPAAEPAKAEGETADDGAPKAPIVSSRTLKRLFPTASGFGVSLFIHAILLVILGSLYVAQQVTPAIFDLVTIPSKDEDEMAEELDQITEPAKELTTVTSFKTDAVQTGPAVSNTQLASAAPTTSEVVATTSDGPPVRVADFSVSGPVTVKTLSSFVPTDVPGEPQAVVDGYQQAMDRLTQEILMMLEHGKVMVVWLFDQSESMKDDQKEIRDRFEKVYQELGLASQAKGDAMLTSICSYGSTWRMHTEEPTYDISKIRAAMDDIPVDPTGKEIMCQAVGKSISFHLKYAKQGGRQIALVLVTDESGEQDDNRNFIEPAIAEAKAARCKIYTIGREAVFGYPYAHMRVTDPIAKVTVWRPINRGPETPEVEQLQTNGFSRRYDAHPSGFGPYEQVRMCRETNGVFFLLPSLETNLVTGEKRKYQLEAMRPYLPDLCDRESYIKKRASSELATRVFSVIQLLNPYDPKMAKHIVMRHTFSLDKVAFAKQVGEEQEKAKQYFLYLQQAQKEFEAMSDIRAKEPQYRWQANHDLIFAQIVAYRVRLYEYGAYLENFKTKPHRITQPFGPNKSNAWTLGVTSAMVTGDKFKDDIALSKKLFNEVIQKHPGTPWAARAQQELARGFGVLLREHFEPNPPRPGVIVRIPNL